MHLEGINTQRTKPATMTGQSDGMRQTLAIRAQIREATLPTSLNHPGAIRGYRRPLKPVNNNPTERFLPVSPASPDDNLPSGSSPLSSGSNSMTSTPSENQVTSPSWQHPHGFDSPGLWQPHASNYRFDAQEDDITSAPLALSRSYVESCAIVDDDDVVDDGERDELDEVLSLHKLKSPDTTGSIWRQPRTPTTWQQQQTQEGEDQEDSAALFSVYLSPTSRLKRHNAVHRRASSNISHVQPAHGVHQSEERSEGPEVDGHDIYHPREVTVEEHSQAVSILNLILDEMQIVEEDIERMDHKQEQPGGMMRRLIRRVSGRKA